MDINTGSIIFFEVKEWEKDIIFKVFPKDKVVLVPESINKTNASHYKNAEYISSFIDSQIKQEVIDQLPKLKLIATRSTGYDHIDVAYAKSKGIASCNVPNYGQNTVAEHSMALILSLTKRIPESIDRVRRGNFSPDGLTGVDLKDKVLGVIGTGNIGCNLITMANGFKMHVIAYDAKPRKELEEQLGFTYVDLNYLFAKSDVISIHVPYFKETHHLIDRNAIDMMKSGVIIINTARGGIIETDALFDGLNSGKIGGAGLDVLEEELFIKEEISLLYKDTQNKADLKVALENHMMNYLPNVIITPHNAFNTKEALLRIIKTTVENINGFINTKPQNIIQ